MILVALKSLANLSRRFKMKDLLMEFNLKQTWAMQMVMTANASIALTRGRTSLNKRRSRPDLA